MEINVNYLKNDFSSDTKLLNAKLGDIARRLSFISTPANAAVCGVSGQPDCKGKINHILDMINGGTNAAGADTAGLSATLNSIVDEVNEMVNGYEWAEKYAMDASVNLLVDTKYTENSMGGGNSNTIREDNIYASMDDTFTVKYIAIYADGSYKYNMILNDGNKDQSIDTKIQELIDSGVIKKDSKIRLSMGITKEQEDGSLGDIGWLPQVDYHPNTSTSGINKTSDREYKKIEFDNEIVDEIKPTPGKEESTSGKEENTSGKEESTSGNYDEKFTQLDQVFYDENGQEVNLAEYLSSIENTKDSNIARQTYSIDAYSGGKYQNTLGSDYDGSMSDHTIQWIRKDLDTDLIREGYVPHITVAVTTFDADGKRNVEQKVLFLNKEDVTLNEDRIDLMSPSKTYSGSENTSTFVSRNNLPTGKITYDGYNVNEMVSKSADTIKITSGTRTVKFDADEENLQGKVEEYIKAFYATDPDAEIKIVGYDKGEGWINMKDTYTTTVTFKADKIAR